MMEKEAIEVLFKYAPISGSIIFLGILALKAITKYVNKRDSERDAFFKEQLEKKDNFYKEQLDRKDRLLELKDQKLEELNLKLTALTRENIEINRSLTIVIQKALRKGYYKDEDDE